MNINEIANKYEEWKRGFHKHSYLQLTDNIELFVDNCVAINKYDENIIELALINNNLSVTGHDLKIGNFSTTGVIIRGKIDSMKFISR
ncbi:MAG: YabP/YqfC family sporulation protein [Oscillospiraceae bacterium]|nr:YabP/YqfC family sporulation protein [Oscillospiraceae bacterium]